ncbi:MAG: hypothetical protein FWH06_06510 [Oscillospiraceae bacterium]|nr:hypothetical protein [Oscillospiraceae bacterium]
MTAWIDAMPLIEKIFFYIALPASLIMIIQTIMLFIGGAGDSGLDSDTSAIGDGALDGLEAADGGLDADGPGYGFSGNGLSFITMRGIITFMTVFGWAGVCLMEMGASESASMAFAILLGIGAMIGVAFLVRGLLSLQAVGNIDYRQALGQYADVYLAIPASGSGRGKVTLTLRGAMSQYDAVTDDDGGIRTGEVVRVTDIVGGNVLVVEREKIEQGGK